MESHDVDYFGLCRPMAASWKALESLASFLVSVVLVAKLPGSLRLCPFSGNTSKEYRRSHRWQAAKSSKIVREVPVVLSAAAQGMQLFAGISALLRQRKDMVCRSAERGRKTVHQARNYFCVPRIQDC